MFCDRCADLCVRYAIRTPGELKNAIKIASQNIDDGTLIEIPANSPLSQVTFESLVKGDRWDDLVYHKFKCTNCGEIFVLHAETYHGSSGYWEPELARSVREQL